MSERYGSIIKDIAMKSEEGDARAISALDLEVIKEAPTGNSGNTVLHVAAAFGRVTLACQLVEMGADVDATTNSGFTPLYWACKNGQKEMALELAALGADPNFPIHKDVAALEIAKRVWGDEEAKLIQEAFEVSQTMLK